jgi:hypothetical protein
MPVARLVLAMLFFCALSAFAQQQPSTDVPSGNLLLWPDQVATGTSGAAPVVPWRIISERTEQADWTKPAQDQLSDGEADKRAQDALNTLTRLMAEHHIDPNSEHPWIKVSPEGELTWGVDTGCYYIRSYVVARDNKDSDATHLVRSSTCQPSRQYGLKTTVMKSDVQAK